MAQMRRKGTTGIHVGSASVNGHDWPVTLTGGGADALHARGARSQQEMVREGFYGGNVMQNTFSSTISTMLEGIGARKSAAQTYPANQTREHNPNSVFPTAQALIRRSARVNVEFTKDAWKQFVALKSNVFMAFIQAFTVKADMALYITAHEEKGIRLDNVCQEVCYEPGVFFLIKNICGTWYITEVLTTGEEEAYAPVFFWTRVKRGCDVLAARVLLRWRRLTSRRADAHIY